MSDIVSRPYKPGKCCERCVFGSGRHTCRKDNREEHTVLRAIPPAPMKITANGIRLVDRPGTYPEPQDFLFIRK